MKIALVLAVVAVAANIFFIWYAKKGNKTKAYYFSNFKNGSYVFLKGYLNTPERKQLRKSVAAELGLSIEELDGMSAKEIRQLANEKGLINIEKV